MKPSISVICLLLCFNLCLGQRLKTPTLSPFSKISQQVGLTEVALQYSRPSAKGRVVFGELEQMRLQELHLRRLQKLEEKQYSQENMPFIPFLVKIVGL